MDGMKKKQVAEHIPSRSEALVEEHEPANDGWTNISFPDHIDSPSVDSLANFDNTINVESPSLQARPPGRKVVKRAKRQTSLEAHSAIGERVAKSLEQMRQSSSSGWQRANDIHEDNQRFAQIKQKLGILNERIVMETNIAKAEKELYDLDPIAMGSPSDKAKRVVEMKNTLAALRAQADDTNSFSQSISLLAHLLQEEEPHEILRAGCMKKLVMKRLVVDEHIDVEYLNGFQDYFEYVVLFLENCNETSRRGTSVFILSWFELLS